MEALQLIGGEWVAGVHPFAVTDKYSGETVAKPAAADEAQAAAAVVAAVTPFNSPLNTVAHKIAPALAAPSWSTGRPRP